MSLRMIALALMTAWGCRASIPPPRRPLVATATEGRPERPGLREVNPPRFPRVSARRRSGGTLWYVSDPTREGVEIAVHTRRGEDGAHPLGLVSLTTEVLGRGLSEVLGPGRVSTKAYGHGAVIQMRVPTRELDRSLAALAAALEGPPPHRRLVDDERILMLQSIEQSAHEPRRSSRAAAMDQILGRPSNLREGVRHWRTRVETFDRARVDACRRERFAPADRLIVVTGAFEVRALRDSFETHFAADRPSPARLPAERIQPRAPAHGALSRPMRSARAHVVYAQPAPPPADPDRMTFALVVDLLGGTFGSRLNGSLRETHSYTYGVHAHVVSVPQVDLLFVEASFDPVDVEGAVRGLFDEMRSVHERPFSAEEIAAARTRLWAQSQAAIEGDDLGAMLGAAWTAELTPTELEGRLAALAEVTPEDVQRVARVHLPLDAGVMVITGDFDAIGGFTVVRDSSGFYLRR